MLKNIKVDIIYYLTGTDFEMEFNLCGCCRMRLLTDKAADKKSFVNMLARAVSRSRVIIACGNLFGDNGLISNIAGAIGKPLSEVDNSKFNIKSDDSISIISGSTPLVTPDGIFGGCIIESGPQTIIVLSESKAVRKTVMKTLIHPYIEQLSLVPEQDTIVPTPKEAQIEPQAEIESELGLEPEEQLSEESEPEEQIEAETEAFEEIEEQVEQETETESEPESEEVILQPEESEETATMIEADEQEDAQPDSFTPDNPENEKFVMETEPAEDESADIEFMPLSSISKAPDMYIEPEQVKFSEKSSYALDYTPSEKDKMFLSEAEAPRNFGKGLNIGMIVVGIILAIMLLALAYLLVYTPLSEGMSIGEYLKSLFEVSSDAEPNIAFILGGLK